MLLHILTLVFTLLLTQGECFDVCDNDTTRTLSEICMEELGCFGTTEEFYHPIHRPLNVLPHHRDRINTKFFLYTRKNAEQPHQLIASSKETFEESNINPQDPTIFIVHGFLEKDIVGWWMTIMKDEFLIHGDYNIILVDWSEGNKSPYYQATANTRVVGAEIALLVETLEKYTGINREVCHIIGHSLGSHVAGYAGKRLKTLGRITGCDPAEPYFQNMPPSVRIDPSDADFVDIIHTDATDIKFIGFGMSHKVGHVDFFVNGGRHQPGCFGRSNFIATECIHRGIRQFGRCSHHRSVELFHHSINSGKRTPVGFECTKWEDFLDGKCAECGLNTERCAVMGFRAIEYKQFRNSSIEHAMYLKTSEKPPYWLYHYQVNIKLFEPRTSYSDERGTIDITLHGSRADKLAHVQAQVTDLYHGALYQYLVTTDKELGEIKNVSLKWFSASLNPFRWPKLYVEYITVLPMNEIEKSPRPMKDRVFCDEPSNGIPPKTVANFNKDDACMKYL